MAYDLLLKGGRVVDPGQNIDEQADIAVGEGRIAALSTAIAESSARRVLDVRGKIVVPGLIDFHVHVFEKGTPIGVNADALLANNGVTTVVDAGSAGAGTYRAFRDYVIQPSHCRVFAFLNISFPGIFHGTTPDLRVGELTDIRLCNIAAAVRMVEEYPEILGIKVRANFDGGGTRDTQPVYLARRAAEEAGRPLMVHFGAPPPLGAELLPLLREGDFITHVFRGGSGNLLTGAGQPVQQLLEARARGVILDLGHGGRSFSFQTARAMLSHGVLPDIVSSDVHAICIDGPTYGLLMTMSKMLNLGMPFEDVIRATTCTPAKAMGKGDELGTLQVGTSADITVLRLEKGDFRFQDTAGEELAGRSRLSAVWTVIGGEVTTNG